MSIPKLRQQYERLRLQAMNQRGRRREPEQPVARAWREPTPLDPQTGLPIGIDPQTGLSIGDGRG